MMNDRVNIVCLVVTQSCYCKDDLLQKVTVECKSTARSPEWAKRMEIVVFAYVGAGALEFLT
jgi:hypothetical protein